MDLMFKGVIDGLLARRDSEPVSIVIDWLSLYFTNEKILSDSYEEGNKVVISENCYLLEIGTPTLHFLNNFVIYYKDEACGHLLTTSRNEKFFKKEIVKVEFANHSLYSGEWENVFIEITQVLGLKYKSVSRLDIAIDGVNYLYELLNIYAKQFCFNKVIGLKNSTEKRCRFSAKVMNPETMYFENFNIGVVGGNKMITVYNKSLEIIRSGKKYIQEYWIKNGVIDESERVDLTKELEKLTFEEDKGCDVYRLPKRNIFRFEIRLKSEAIGEIKDFDISYLRYKDKLASIVKTHCEKYFEGFFYDNTNVSRCTEFELLPFAKLSGKYMEKVERVKGDGTYKAKMAIHGALRDVLRGYILEENYNETATFIINRIVTYDLTEYYVKNKDTWITSYLNEEKCKNSKAFFAGVEYMLLNLIEAEKVSVLEKRNRKYTTEDWDIFNEKIGLAKRNGQAGATANFGE